MERERVALWWGSHLGLGRAPLHSVQGLAVVALPSQVHLDGAGVQGVRRHLGEDVQGLLDREQGAGRGQDGPMGAHSAAFNSLRLFELSNACPYSWRVSRAYIIC